jgi:alkanesulfonate monooxygenase SsuD/methylene tetrahydromethanopterin reductase-like flavin-dependent oxidoreductase (luciferase family)
LRTAIAIGGPGQRHRDRDASWTRTVAFVQEAEKLGVWAVWAAEGWSSDAISPLADLHARIAEPEPSPAPC